MNAVACKQAVRRDGDRVQSSVATEHTNEALFNDLDSLGKAWSVAKLMFEPRKLRSDDRICIVGGIRQLRHGDAEQPIEARWLEMNGEVVDTSRDRHVSPSLRLRTHHGDTRRGVAAIRPRPVHTVRVCEEERQELLRPCRQRDNERDAAPPRSHAVSPDVRPQHRTRWSHLRMKHFCNPSCAVYRLSGSHAERFARRGKASISHSGSADLKPSVNFGINYAGCPRSRAERLHET